MRDKSFLDCLTINNEVEFENIANFLLNYWLFVDLVKYHNFCV